MRYIFVNTQPIIKNPSPNTVACLVSFLFQPSNIGPVSRNEKLQMQSKQVTTSANSIYHPSFETSLRECSSRRRLARSEESVCRKTLLLPFLTHLQKGITEIRSRDHCRDTICGNLNMSCPSSPLCGGHGHVKYWSISWNCNMTSCTIHR